MRSSDWSSDVCSSDLCWAPTATASATPAPTCTGTSRSTATTSPKRDHGAGGGREGDGEGCFEGDQALQDRCGEAESAACLRRPYSPPQAVRRCRRLDPQSGADEGAAAGRIFLGRLRTHRKIGRAHV